MLGSYSQIGTVIQVLARKTGVSKKNNEPYAIDRFIIKNGNSEYDDIICFEVFSNAKNHPMVDCGGVKVGDLVNVHFGVNSREFDGKYYTDVRAWKIEHIDGNVTPNNINEEYKARQAEQTAEQKFPEQSAPMGTGVGQNNTGDLPF